MNTSAAAKQYQKQQSESERQREMLDKTKDFTFINMMLKKPRHGREEMRLSRTARHEVQDIADNLPDSELDFIAAEVDARMNQHKINPLMPALCAFLTKHYDYPAIEMFDEDDASSTEAAEEFLREALVRVARREVAIGIYRNKHGNQEAA